jgi:transcriptional regulator with XRE-family HTH domain
MFRQRYKSFGVTCVFYETFCIFAETQLFRNETKSMAAQLDTDKLAHAIRSKRGNQALRTAAQEIEGVSFTTLSRLEQGHVPDVDTYVNICKWLGASTDSFLTESTSAPSQMPHQKVEALLRADPVLPRDVADALIKMVAIVYQKYISPQESMQ